MVKQRIRRISLVLSSLALGAGSVFWVTPSALADSVMCDGLPATIVGTNGNDTLTGTAGPDVIAGLDGNDTISGLDGDDIICGGNGEDTIYGNVEILTLGLVSGDNDRIFGDNGEDLLIGDFARPLFWPVPAPPLITTTSMAARGPIPFREAISK